MKKSRLPAVLAILFAFAMSCSVIAQQVTDYRHYSWNALQENWNVAGAMLVSPPTSGTILRAQNGDLTYRNDDISAQTDRFTLLMNAGDLLAEVEVSVDKATGILTYNFSGYKSGSTANSSPMGLIGGNENGNGSTTPGVGTPPGGVGTTVTLPGSNVTGTVVGLPGTNAPIPTGGTTQIFVTDNTVSGDSGHIWWDLGGSGVYNNGVTSWFDVADVVGSVPAGTIDVFVFSGHGSAVGGVATGGTHLTDGNLTPTVTSVIGGGAAPGAVIVILACQQGEGLSASGCQDLSTTLGIPVIVNTGNVNSGSNGEGTWVQIDP